MGMSVLHRSGSAGSPKWKSATRFESKTLRRMKSAIGYPVRLSVYLPSLESREIMSISAISNAFSSSQTGALYQLQNSQFQQLGQDLTSGNLSGAQSDFNTLQQAFAQTGTAASSSTSSNPAAQAFQQLATDLKSGNLSGSQQDYSKIQQDLNSRSGFSHLHFQRPAGGGGSGGGQSTLLQDLNQLGQDLSSSTFLSGNLSAAQQAYGAPIQAFDPVMTGGLGSGLQASSLAPGSDPALSFMA
jgi:hypothetical protein